MKNASKHILRFVVPALLAATSLTSCLRDAGTGPAETVTVKQDASVTGNNPRVDFLVNVLGIAPDNIGTYVDSIVHDTSYVLSPKPSAAIAQLASKRKRALHQGAIALRESAIDTMMSRYAKQQLSGGIDISSQNTLGTPAADPATGAPTPATGSVPGGLAKSAHTRWVSWSSLLDVKALTEVHQVRVYIVQSTPSRIEIGPHWLTAIRYAIDNWNSQAKGSAISFVETSDINTSDVVIHGALMDASKSYIVWLNPGPYVERIQTYGGTDPSKNVDLVLNIGFEHNTYDGMPMNEKTKAAMAALANILNIGWIDTENMYWNFGDYTYIPGTLHSDGDALTPGSSIMTNSSSQVSTGYMTPGDVQLFRTLYPSHAITAKLWNNTLTAAGYEGFTTISTNVKDFQTEGDTLIFSTYDGKLYRRVGLDGSNVQLWPGSGSSGSVNTFVYSKGYFVVTVAAGPKLYSKTPTGSWVMQFSTAGSNVRPHLDGEKLYISNYSSPYGIYLKYLTSNPSTWYLEWQSGHMVDDYQVHNGIMVVADNGSIYAKQDGVYNWIQLYYGVTGSSYYPAAQRIFMSDNLIAFYRRGYGAAYGYAAVMVGGLTGSLQYIPDPMNGPEDMDVCGDKFAYTQEGSYLRVTDFGTWTVYEHYNIPGHYDNTAAVRLGGGNCDHVTIVDKSNNLWAKYGELLNTDYFPYQTGVVALSQRP